MTGNQPLAAQDSIERHGFAIVPNVLHEFEVSFIEYSLRDEIIQGSNLVVA